MSKLTDLAAQFYNSPSYALFNDIVSNYSLRTGSHSQIMDFMQQWFYKSDDPSFIPEARVIVQHVVDSNLQIPTMGASGAVFGLLIAFAMTFPDVELMLIFLPIPIKAKYFVPFYALIELFFGVAGFQWDNVAHFAHLGGFVGGFLSLKFFQWRSPANAWKRKTAPAVKRESGPSALARWNSIKRDEMHEVNRAELDRILDQISTTGLASLTPSDREFLERFSARGKH